MMKTVGVLAKENIPAGISYDHALSGEWFNAMMDLEVDPRGKFVWMFDEVAPLFGRPYCIFDKYPDQARIDHDQKEG